MNSRIVILNYNGKSLLQRCLPSVEKATHQSHYPCKVTILDNQSTDDSEKWVKENFSDVQFVKSPKNLIYCSYNDYFKIIDEPIVIILNNDIWVEPTFIDPLIRHFISDDKLFLVSPKSLHVETGCYEGNLSKMEMHFGLIWGSSQFRGHENKIHSRGMTMQSGYGAFRRSVLLQLGGFDRLYLPGTVEDTDLCFRAYRAGFRAEYCPESIVYHLGQASFKKEFGEFRLRRMNRRNLYLFVWKNIRDPWLLMSHILYVPLHILKYILYRELDFLLGFWDALKRLPWAYSRRLATRDEKSIRSDKEIFRLSQSI